MTDAPGGEAPDGHWASQEEALCHTGLAVGEEAGPESPLHQEEGVPEAAVYLSPQFVLQEGLVAEEGVRGHLGREGDAATGDGEVGAVEGARVHVQGVVEAHLAEGGEEPMAKDGLFLDARDPLLGDFDPKARGGPLVQEGPEVEGAGAAAFLHPREGEVTCVVVQGEGKERQGLEGAGGAARGAHHHGFGGRDRETAVTVPSASFDHDGLSSSVHVARTRRQHDPRLSLP